MNRRRGILAGSVVACTAITAFGVLYTGSETRPPAVERSLTAVSAPQPATYDAGVLADAVSDAHGRLFALDVQRKAILVMDGSRNPPSWVGRPGHGPGEFVAPVSLVLDATGRLLVLDPGTMRIEAFRTDSAGTRGAGHVPLAFPAEDMAVCEGRLFLLGSWNHNLIHEISPVDGAVLRSFAPDSVAADDLMAGYRSSGYLECGPGAALTFLPMLRPELTRFSIATGAQIGTLVIPGYQAVQVERRADGGLTFRSPEGRQHDRASSVTTLPDSTQLVQVGILEEGATTRHEFSQVRSYLVSWDEPSIREMDVELPRIIRAAGDSVLVVETDPAPRVFPARIIPGQPETSP